MNQYKIIHKFGTFIYNPKNKSHKIKWYEVGDVVDQPTFDRFSDGTKRHCDKINNRKRKPTKKK